MNASHPDGLGVLERAKDGMNGTPNAPTPARPLPDPARGIEELKPRILATWDVVDLAKFGRWVENKCAPTS
jgi:hypothetical protein